MIQYLVTRLDNDEYDVLTKIAKKTKCDCWFSLRRDDKGEDVVYDLECDEDITLYSGVYDLMEALDCKENYDACNLTVDEEMTLANILMCLGIRHPGDTYKYEHEG